jgi:hypothetical protein
MRLAVILILMISTHVVFAEDTDRVVYSQIGPSWPTHMGVAMYISRFADIDDGSTIPICKFFAHAVISPSLNQENNSDTVSNALPERVRYEFLRIPEGQHGISEGCLLPLLWTYEPKSKQELYSEIRINRSGELALEPLQTIPSERQSVKKSSIYYQSHAIAYDEQMNTFLLTDLGMIPFNHPALPEAIRFSLESDVVKFRLFASPGIDFLILDSAELLAPDETWAIFGDRVEPIPASRHRAQLCPFGNNAEPQLLFQVFDPVSFELRSLHDFSLMRKGRLYDPVHIVNVYANKTHLMVFDTLLQTVKEDKTGLILESATVGTLTVYSDKESIDFKIDASTLFRDEHHKGCESGSRR